MPRPLGRALLVRPTSPTDGGKPLRLAYETVVREFGDNGAEALVSLNDDRRPRLSLEQRREMVVDLRQEGHSYQAIGGALGVHETTAMRDFRKAGPAHAGPGGPEQIVGLDGKTYPAKRDRGAAAHSVKLLSACECPSFAAVPGRPPARWTQGEQGL